jgi:hypothetical protein
MTSCRTTSTRSRPGSRERTETLLVANPDRPGGLLKVTLSSGDDDVRTPVASEDATLDTMLEMARSIGDSARQLEQPPEWRLHGNNRGLGKLMVNANRLVPVVSQLVRTVGRFAAKPALAGRAATTRLGVNVGSSGRVYGGMLRGGRQEILVSTTDTHSRMSGDFSLTFKYGGGSGDEEFAFANCTLRLEDRTGTWPWSATQDTLEQRGTELWRIRRQQIGTAAPTTIGEYPATDATILDMAHAAITAQDIPIR